MALTAIAGCASSVTPAGQSDASGADQIALTDATHLSDVHVTTDVRGIIDTGVASAVSISCPADAGVGFPASLAQCNVATDCVAVVHGLDCCGSTEIVGINVAQQTAYAVPEAACEMRVGYNMCDCAAHAPVAQEGHTIPGGTDAGLDCVGGVCMTHVGP